MPTSTITKTPIKKNAARTAAASYRRSKPRRIEASLMKGVDRGLTVGTGFLEPLARHHFAYLLELRFKARRRRFDFHAVLRELLEIEFALLLARFPAARI